MISYERHILSLSDEELERFVRQWVERKAATYLECTRFSGPGDLGRDVVGFLSPKRHEGEWHNYQCKQYSKTLPTEDGIREIGKILFYAHQGHFTPPAKYFFVAPRGVNRNLEHLIFKPSAFRSKLLSEWDKYCATNIIEGKYLALDDSLRTFIEAYDFASITRLSVDEILLDPNVNPVLIKWFGADPGPAPAGQVPAEVQDSELPYVGQLVGAYEDRDGVLYASHSAVESHPRHGPHLARQRERFFDADAFLRFYRDNTDKRVLEAFERDVYHGVVEAYEIEYKDSLSRVDAVMLNAVNIPISGLLMPHTRISVKQGVCHHFANSYRFVWRR